MKNNKEIQQKLTKLQQQRTKLEKEINLAAETITHLNTFIPKLEAPIKLADEIKKQILINIDKVISTERNLKERNKLVLNVTLKIFNENKNNLLKLIDELNLRDSFLNEEKSFMKVKYRENKYLNQVIEDLKASINSDNEINDQYDIIKKLKPFFNGEYMDNYLHVFTESIKNELRKAQTIKENSGKELERINAEIESLNKELTTTKNEIDINNPSTADEKNINGAPSSSSEIATLKAEQTTISLDKQPQQSENKEQEKHVKLPTRRRSLSFSDADKNVNQTTIQQDYNRIGLDFKKILDLLNEYSMESQNKAYITQITNLKDQIDSNKNKEPETQAKCLLQYLENALKIHEELIAGINSSVHNKPRADKFAKESNNLFISFINSLITFVNKVLVYFNLKKPTTAAESSEDIAINKLNTIKNQLNTIKIDVEKHQKDLEKKPTLP